MHTELRRETSESKLKTIIKTEIKTSKLAVKTSTIGGKRLNRLSVKSFKATRLLNFFKFSCYHFISLTFKVQIFTEEMMISESIELP